VFFLDDQGVQHRGGCVRRGGDWSVPVLGADLSALAGLTDGLRAASRL
jgi:hypothetical protein